MPFEWQADFEVGFDSMDQTHHEFVHCVRELLECDEAGIRDALERFERHAKDHFGQEDRWMAETNYGSAGCHVDEHAAVLRSVAQVREAVDGGRSDVARALARELARWFPDHAKVMDRALALWIQTQRLGGVPMAIVRPSQKHLRADHPGRVAAGVHTG